MDFLLGIKITAHFGGVFYCWFYYFSTMSTNVTLNTTDLPAKSGT